MSYDKQGLIEWVKGWHKQNNEDGLPLLEWLIRGEEICFDERCSNFDYVDVFEALYKAGKFDADWLLDYLAETGELEVWYDDAEFLEEGQ
jgi:hypothetical protein